MITAMVDNHGVENSQDTFSKSHSTGAACNECLLCSEEDMAKGRHDSSGPQGILGVFWLLSECSGTASRGWQPYMRELQEESC